MPIIKVQSTWHLVDPLAVAALAAGPGTGSSRSEPVGLLFESLGAHRGYTHSLDVVSTAIVRTTGVPRSTP